MDPTQIIATYGQLAQAGAAIGAAVPFTALVKRILGPAADEIAERVRDEIRIYRYGRQLSLLNKAEHMAKEAGFTPKAVPVKLLFALLEGASLEENEDLHDKWAALLANAANPAAKVQVRPSFTDTLKLFNPETARLLDAAYTKAGEDPRGPASHDRVSGRPWEPYDERDPTVSTVDHRSKPRERTLRALGYYGDIYHLYCTLGLTALPAGTVITSDSPAAEIEQDELDRQRFAVTMDELSRFQMWSITPQRTSGERFYLTAYAVQFVEACSPPASLDQR